MVDKTCIEFILAALQYYLDTFTVQSEMTAAWSTHGWTMVTQQHTYCQLMTDINHPAP